MRVLIDTNTEDFKNASLPVLIPKEILSRLAAELKGTDDTPNA